MSDRVLTIYRTLANELILKTAHGLAGQAKTILSDFEQFRKAMIEPAWNQMPAQAKLIGRTQLRWDDVMQAISRELFTERVDGRLSVRPDAADRISAAVERVVNGSRPPSRPNVVPPPTPPPLPGTTPASRGLSVAGLKTTEQSDDVELLDDVSPSSGQEFSIGIDLGTTYSAIAYVDGTGRPTTLHNAAGELITPSVVLFDDEGPVVGKEAVSAAPMEPDRVAICVKRDMGFKEYRKPVNGVRLPPEVISSVILKTLLADARRRLGPGVAKAVITVPAYFDERRRRATVDAGRIAGLDVLDIINEPTAAALAFGYQSGFLDTEGRVAGDKPMTVLVYDLGGGTFDVTIVEIRGNAFRAIATDGDVNLGGKDFDEMIVFHAAQKFEDAYGQDPRKNLPCFMEMWNSAEHAKKTLSERTKASVVVNLDGKRLKVDITRQEFEDLTAPLVGRTRTTTEIVLRQAGLSWDKIDRVLLVGGSSRMPMIPAMLRQISGKEPDRSISPDEAVAHGAALYARLLQKKASATPGDRPGFSITNINSHSLGIIGFEPGTTRRRNAILIPKNTPLPVTVTKVFKTNKPNQPQVVIRVVEGESERPEACMEVGVCRIDNLPSNLPQGTPVQVQYSYHENGQLEVLGQVAGAEAVRTVFHRENSLDGDQLSMWTKYLASIEA